MREIFFANFAVPKTSVQIHFTRSTQKKSAKQNYQILVSFAVAFDRQTCFRDRQTKKNQRRMLTVVVNEAGVDEAGCGSLIGPLVSAAVILPEQFDTTGLNDSKKLSKKKRDALFARINDAAAVGVGIVTLDEINRESFSWARRTVFTRALANLAATPRSIVVDGTHFFDGYDDIPFKCEAKADATHASVAAASIVAKCTRDEMVKNVCAANQESAERYGWMTNMGYPTKAHKDAIREHGCTPYHRIKFSPCRS